MNNDKNKDAKKTVGEVGSGIPGGFDPANENEQEVTNNDLKGKKVDADPSQPSGKPAEQ